MDGLSLSSPGLTLLRQRRTSVSSSALNHVRWGFQRDIPESTEATAKAYFLQLEAKTNVWRSLAQYPRDTKASIYADKPHRQQPDAHRLPLPEQQLQLPAPSDVGQTQDNRQPWKVESSSEGFSQR